MSVIVINYNKLDDAADYAEKGIKRCKKYIDDLENVQKKLTSGDIRDVEDNGSVNTALNLARRKMEEAQSFKSTFTECAKAINNAKVTVKEKDRAAASNINTIMNAYLGRRGILSKAKEFMYRQYTCFLDKIGGMGELGKKIKEFIKNIEVGFDSWLEKAKNWFKYGNGKYLANVLDGVKNVVAATVGLILAVGAVVTGPVWLTVVGVAGVVLSGIYLISQIINTYIRNEENSKAIALSKQGHITAARYYGDIDGFREWTNRRDFGGETANNIVEGLGVAYEAVEIISKYGAKACNLVSGVAKLGVTYNAKGDYIVDWKRAFTGYKYKAAHDAGFYSNNYQTGGFSWKTAFSPIENIISSKSVKAISNIGIDKGTVGYVITNVFGYGADAIKTWDNIVDIKKGVETLVTPKSGFYNEVKAVMDTAGNLPIVDAFVGDAWGIVSDIKNLITPSASSISITAPAATPAIGGGGWIRF